MAKIRQTLNKIRDELQPLLVEMYPELMEAIAFHHQEDFQEWFGMLFESHKWTASSRVLNIDEVLISKSKSKEIEHEIVDYEGLTDFGYISVVLIDGELHLIDGYHRVLVAKQRDLLQLKGVVWEKAPNNHPNCQKIKNLIIDNL